MSRMVLHQNLERGAYGAELAPGPLEQVALDRLAGARLTFAGRHLTLHRQRLPWGDDLTVTLWAKQKSGYVVSFQVFDGEGLRPHAAATETIDDAICFLEDYCTRLPEPVVQGDSFEETILTLQRSITCRSLFLTLVGEALAAWVDLPEKTAKKTQQKANA